MAEFRHCAIGSAARLSVNLRIDKARETFAPRIISITSRALRGLPLRFLSLAVASIFLFAFRHLLRFCPRMALENARRREFPKLMSDHVLGHKDRYVPFAVVNAECQTYHLWRDRRASRPCADRRRFWPAV